MEKYKIPRSYAGNAKNNQQNPDKQLKLINVVYSVTQMQKMKNLEITHNISAIRGNILNYCKLMCLCFIYRLYIIYSKVYYIFHE